MIEKSKAKAKKIVSGRELLSHIRSAFAFQDRIFLYLDDTPTECTIISFNDADLRDTEIDRDVEITLPKTSFHSKAKEGQPVRLEIILDSAKLEINCDLAYIRPASLVVRLPKEAELHQLRNSNRFSVENQEWADALIFSDAQASPCVFKVIDFSSGGIGILVGSSVKLEQLGSNLKIRSDFSNEHYHFKGPYEIKRLQLLKESDNFYEYNVGIVEMDVENIAEGSSHKRAGRHSVDSTLQLLVTATNTKLHAKVSDVSISGFRATIPSSAAPGLAKGLVAIEASSQIKFKIIRTSKNGQTAFQLLSDEPHDQIKWLNLISLYEQWQSGCECSRFEKSD